MGVGDAKVEPVVPVSEMAKAKEFYEGKLGLSEGRDVADGGRTYVCAGGSEIHIFPSTNAGKSDTTVAGWDVDDTERVVDELTSKGVTFEQYDEAPLTTDEKGIATIDGAKVAWFRDPDGNTLGIIQG
jgi:catechol 2,3-dioxygenase-like lactoylglutathione lyase family enzyme